MGSLRESGKAKYPPSPSECANNPACLSRLLEGFWGLANARGLSEAVKFARSLLMTQVPAGWQPAICATWRRGSEEAGEFKEAFLCSADGVRFGGYASEGRYYVDFTPAAKRNVEEYIERHRLLPRLFYSVAHLRQISLWRYKVYTIRMWTGELLIKISGLRISLVYTGGDVEELARRISEVLGLSSGEARELARAAIEGLAP